MYSTIGSEGDTGNALADTASDTTTGAAADPGTRIHWPTFGRRLAGRRPVSGWPLAVGRHSTCFGKPKQVFAVVQKHFPRAIQHGKSGIYAGHVLFSCLLPGCQPTAGLLAAGRRSAAARTRANARCWF